MFGLSSSELWLYGGAALMVAAGIFTLAGILTFYIRGRNLKAKLEKEYGKPWK